MEYAVRLNSFKQHPKFQDKKLSTIDTIKLISEIDGVTSLELNFPQAFLDTSYDQLKNAIDQSGLKVSGIALRFEHDYLNGEFSNPDPKIRQKAVKTTKDAVEMCNSLNGSVTTIWPANDGFDYSFQIDYASAWDDCMQGIKEVAQAFPDDKISFEYKPYQPRTHSLIDGIGLTLLMLEEIGQPNLGVTLDFCHMLMKRENPAYSLALAAQRNRLFGFHLNDGYQDNDDGLMLGSVHLLQTLEFIYYAQKYHYDEVNYFDTFPIREDPVKECEANIKMYQRLVDFVNQAGLSAIQKLIDDHDGIKVQKLLLDLLGEVK